MPLTLLRRLIHVILSIPLNGLKRFKSQLQILCCTVAGMDEPAPRENYYITAFGAAIGLAYGLSIRYGSRLLPHSQVFQVMTLSFMFFLPFAMGFITIFIVERRRPQPIWIWFLLPWLPVAAGEAATAAALWEGLICIVMFTPIALGASSLGGAAAGAIVRFVRSRRSSEASLVCVMCLPLLLSSFEPRFLLHQELRNVESVIDIAAPPATVWQNIERVPRIRASELQSSWSHAIGFPDPVEATLSAEGIGGVRHATFAGGVLFIETIDVWEPDRRLGFSIRADQIPPTTLDEHVTVGGKFFDVLYGEYYLEPLPNGETRLHLLSRHRVSTDFNWYAHLWTDAVMSDLQQRILLVVKNRSELVANHI